VRVAVGMLRSSRFRLRFSERLVLLELHGTGGYRGCQFLGELLRSQSCTKAHMKVGLTWLVAGMCQCFGGPLRRLGAGCTHRVPPLGRAGLPLYRRPHWAFGV
jgi:hypothetical protein